MHTAYLNILLCIAYCGLNFMQTIVKITASFPEFVDHKRSDLVFLITGDYFGIGNTSWGRKIDLN